MKKKLLALLLIVVVLSLSLTAFVACNKDEDQPENVTNYSIPTDLTLNVGVYNGETLVGQITKDTLTSLTQYRVTMNTINDYGTEKTTVYIAYKVTDALEKLGKTLPEFTKVKSIATDDYEGEYEISSLANAYITIGQEEDGAFAADDSAPRFLSDSTSTSSNSVAKYISKIILNPVTTPVNSLTAIAAADKYTVPALSIAVKNGETDLVTINNATVADLTQYQVAIYESATEYKEYVGFKFTDILGDSIPATITAVKVATTNCEITSIANSIIIFAKVADAEADRVLNNSPRFIPDYTTAVNTDDIVKNATTIVFNPVADPEAAATEAYTITLSWSETNLALTAVITDLDSNKSNTVIISTAENANTFINIDDKSVATEPKKSDLDLEANKKIEYVNKNTTYYGYDLKTILAAMQFRKSSGSLISIIDADNYDFVGWTCSDDDAEADFTARAYTKAEIEANVISVVFDANAKGEDGKTRIFSALDDTDPATYRNKSKKVLTLVLYKSAE